MGDTCSEERMSKVKFYICEHCKKIVTVLTDAPAPLTCCGEALKELQGNVTDAAVDKHMTVIAVDGNQVKVTVSSVEHPMVEVHYIDWVCLETEKGIQVHHLTVGEKPETVFGLADGDKVVAAYAYCNLHGLWKTEA